MKLGRILVDSLRFKEGDSSTTIESGLSKFSHDQLGFNDLPTGATDSIVGVLPSADKWRSISPNDRWVAGIDRSDLVLFDTA